MFRGKIKGRKGNDQDGVGRKKVRNAVNLKVCKDSEQTRENSIYVASLHRQGILLLHYLKISYVCVQLW